LKTANQEFDELKAHYRDLQERHAALQATLVDASSCSDDRLALKNLETKHAELQRQYDELQERHKELQAAFDDLIPRYEDLPSLENLQTQYVELFEQHKDLQAEYQDLRDLLLPFTFLKGWPLRVVKSALRTVARLVKSHNSRGPQCK
jgi:chromosome segregation ATPase